MKISKKIIVIILSVVIVLGVLVWGLRSGKFCSDEFHIKGKEAHEIELKTNMREYVKKYEGQPKESIPKPDFDFAYRCRICGYSEFDENK